MSAVPALISVCLFSWWDRSRALLAQDAWLLAPWKLAFWCSRKHVPSFNIFSWISKKPCPQDCFYFYVFRYHLLLRRSPPKPSVSADLHFWPTWILCIHFGSWCLLVLLIGFQSLVLKVFLCIPQGRVTGHLTIPLTLNRFYFSIPYNAVKKISFRALMMFYLISFFTFVSIRRGYEC